MAAEVCVRSLPVLYSAKIDTVFQAVRKSREVSVCQLKCIVLVVTWVATCPCFGNALKLKVNSLFLITGVTLKLDLKYSSVFSYKTIL